MSFHIVPRENTGAKMKIALGERARAQILVEKRAAVKDLVRLRIGIGDELVSSCGFELNRTRFDLSYGEGHDACRARIAESPSGRYKFHQRTYSKALQCATAYFPEWMVRRTTKWHDCEIIEARAGMLIVKLPAELMREEDDV